MTLSFSVTKMEYLLPVSVDSLFDTPREGLYMPDPSGLFDEPVEFCAPWPLWLRKAWLRSPYREGLVGPRRPLP